MKKLKFRVHLGSLGFSYWRRCSFHCRFLFIFGGISNSGSERETGKVSEQRVTAVWFLHTVKTTQHFSLVTDHQPAQKSDPAELLTETEFWGKSNPLSTKCYHPE